MKKLLLLSLLISCGKVKVDLDDIEVKIPDSKHTVLHVVDVSKSLSVFEVECEAMGYVGDELNNCVMNKIDDLVNDLEDAYEDYRGLDNEDV